MNKILHAQDILADARSFELKDAPVTKQLAMVERDLEPRKPTQRSWRGLRG